MKTWRLVILLIFVLCLAIQVGLAFKVYVRGEINPGDLTPLLTKLFAVYSVPLAVIGGGFFASKGSNRRATAPEIWAVVILSLVWNGFFLVRYCLYAFGKEDSVAQLGSYMDAVSTSGSFLISGALAFLYGRSSS